MLRANPAVRWQEPLALVETPSRAYIVDTTEPLEVVGTMGVAPTGEVGGESVWRVVYSRASQGLGPILYESMLSRYWLTPDDEVTPAAERIWRVFYDRERAGDPSIVSVPLSDPAERVIGEYGVANTTAAQSPWLFRAYSRRSLAPGQKAALKRGHDLLWADAESQSPDEFVEYLEELAEEVRPGDPWRPTDAAKLRRKLTRR